MGWDHWSNYPKSSPRAVKDGLKTKNQRGAIGETWWSKRFISILERFDIGARLSRGRSYARSGQVMSLDIAPGRVTAKVQGSQRTPYKVTIDVRPLSDSDWRSVEEAMAGQAIFLAKLLAGEMPNDIEEAFTGCRLSLFPETTRDIESDCSCPDWSNPCKHVAAAYYLLAERFDDDPFLIFLWRGRDKEALLERLRELRGTTTEETEEAPISAFVPPPLDASLTEFWTLRGEIAPAVLPDDVVPDAVLKILDTPPKEVVLKPLSELYERIVGDARKRLNE